MRILITGGAGFVGQHLVRQLRFQYPDASITVADLRPNPHPLYDIERLATNVFYGVDITRKETLDPVFAGQDYVFHLAGMISFWRKHKEALFKTNTDAVQHVVDACLKHNIRKLVHVSSVASLGYRDDKDNPIDETFSFPFHTAPNKYYMLSKRKGQDLVEQAVRERRLPAIIACPALMYGAGDFANTSHLIQGIKERRLRVNMPGGTHVADVEDVAKGLVALFMRGRIGERYILGGYNLTFKEINAVVAKELDMPSPKLTLPRFLRAPVYHAFDTIERLSKERLPVDSDSVESGFYFRYFDNSKANRELDWRVEKPFAQTIREQIQYLKHREML